MPSSTFRTSVSELLNSLTSKSGSALRGELTEKGTAIFSAYESLQERRAQNRNVGTTPPNSIPMEVLFMNDDWDLTAPVSLALPASSIEKSNSWPSTVLLSAIADCCLPSLHSTKFEEQLINFSTFASFPHQILQPSKGDKEIHIFGRRNLVLTSETNQNNSLHLVELLAFSAGRSEGGMSCPQRKPRTPAFNQKMTRKALWVDGCSTPAWVKVRLKWITQGRLQSRAYGIVGSVIRQMSGVEKVYNPSLQRVQHVLNAFRDQWRLQKIAAVREAEAEAVARFQGLRWPDNNVAQLDAPSPQTHSGAAKWREVANTIEQNRNPSYEVVGGIELRQQNTDSLKVELERVGVTKAKLTSLIAANRVLEIQEPEHLSREEEEHSSAICEEGVTETLGREHLITEELLRKAHWVDGRSTPASMKAGLVLIGQGGLQSRANCGSRDWSRASAHWNGRTDIHSVGTTSQAIAGQNCLERSITTDPYTHVKLLQMCSKQKDFLAAKQVHDHIIQTGMDKNVYVAVTLMNVYIKCGALLDARRVFDQLDKKSVVTWTNMIAGYSKSGHAESALELFYQMRQEGAEPNEITYLRILKAFASPLTVKWGKEIHEFIRHAGFESDVRVGTALLQMYAKCGCIMEARKVFDNLTNRNVITWTVMISGLAQHGFGHEAYQLFLQMRREGFEPDAFTYVSILNASASDGALEWVKVVHGHARKAGLESNLRVGNALVDMYAHSGSIDEARLVFDRMEKRDVFTWTVMIGGLAQHGCGNEALELLHQMHQEGAEPNEVTYLSILKACTGPLALKSGKEIHEFIRRAGYESDVRVGTALLQMYAKCGCIMEARQVFEKLTNRNVITWTVMISGLAQHGFGHEAYQLFLQMRREGLEPDACTYVSILNASASDGALEWVKVVHGHARKAGLESNLRVGTALVDMYAQSGSIDDARLVFGRMEKRDVFTWTVMIGGLAQHGCGNEALELFREMTAEGVNPDGASFVAVLSACCHGGLVKEGRRVFSAMTQNYGIEPETVQYNCMVDLLGRAGRLEEVNLFISDMPDEPDIVTWTALLGACRTYGNVELGELAAKKLFKLEPSKASTYVLLSNIYAAAGKWEKVSLVRTMMHERGVRKEPGRSWIEVDNKVHEFVVGDTYHPEANAIYSELIKLTEKLKAEGYIPDTRHVLHDINEEDKELALCSHSEKLAIAYGLIHIPREEPIRVTKNLRVCPDCHTATKLISKATRREIIARDANRFHHFKDGVCSCGDYW